MTSFLEPPSLPDGFVRRREYEQSLAEVLGQSGADPPPIIITNPAGTTATGKTLLLASVLRSLLKDGRVGRVLWVSFGQYLSDIPPYLDLLCSLANALRRTFATKLASPCSISQLRGASVEECQDYIRLLMMAARSADKRGADGVVLVLDEVTRAQHASVFAHLGLRTVVTTRDVATVGHLLKAGVDREESKQILEVGRLTPLQAESLVMRTTNASRSLSSSKAFRLLQQQLTGSLRCFCMLSSVFSIDDAHNEKLTQCLHSAAFPVRYCMQAVLAGMPAVERTALEKLLLLPIHGSTTLALAAQLWKQSIKSAAVRVAALANQGLIVLSGDKKSFHIPQDCVEALSDLSFLDASPFAADLNLPVRIEAAHSILLYVTDTELLANPAFSEEYLLSFVACWQHLLQLDSESSFGEHCSRPSPSLTYSRLLQDSAADHTVAAHIFAVVLSINPDSFSLCHGSNAWSALRRWAIEGIYPFIDVKIDRAVTLEPSAYLGFALCLIDYDSEKAAACIEIFLQVFCSANENVNANSSPSAEATLLLQISDAFFLLTRCHIRSGSLVEARETFQSAFQSWQEAFGILVPTKDQAGIAFQPDAISLKLMDVSLTNAEGRHQEAHLLLHDAISACEDAAPTSPIAKELLSVYCSFLGETLSAQGFRNKARKALEECVAIRLELHGDYHPATLNSMEMLASSCLVANLFEKSTVLLRRVLSIRSTLYGIDHPALRSTVVALCSCMNQKEGARQDEVVHFLRTLLKEFAALDLKMSRCALPQGYACRGDQVDGYVQALHLMSEIGLSQNNEREAKAFSKKALEVIACKKSCGVVPCYDLGISVHAHRQLGDAHNHMGSVCQRRKRHLKAAENFHLALVHFIHGGSGIEARKKVAEDLNFALQAEGCQIDADVFAFVMSDVSWTGSVPRIEACKLAFTAPAVRLLLQALEDANETDRASKAHKVLHVGPLAFADESKGEAESSDHLEAPTVRVDVKNVPGNAFSAEALHTTESVLSVLKSASTESDECANDISALETTLNSRSERADEEAKLEDLREVPEQSKIVNSFAAQGVDAMVDNMLASETTNETNDAFAGDAAGDTFPNSADVPEVRNTSTVADTTSADPYPASLALADLPHVDRSSEIIAACLSNDKSCVKVLLEEGADVNTRSEGDGSTLLLIATINQHVGLIEVLLQSGADASLQDNDGNSPLMVACMFGNCEIYALLLDKHGSLPDMFNSRDVDGKNPLLVAIEQGHMFIIADILRREVVNVNAVDGCGNTALIIAVLSAREEVVNLLLAVEGVNASLANSHGDTPLLLATLQGNVSIVRSLLFAGADKRAANIDGTTAMDVAVWNSEEDMFALLIKDDFNAAKIQSLWRMYRVRTAIGRKIDEHIANSARSRWAQLHLAFVVKIQTRIRIFISRKRFKRLQLESISARADQYALMKVVAVLQPLASRYVRVFRALRNQTQNSSRPTLVSDPVPASFHIPAPIPDSAAIPILVSAPVADVPEILDQVAEHNSERTESVQVASVPFTPAKRDTPSAVLVNLSPRAKRFANAFSMVAKPSSNIETSYEENTKVQRETTVFRPSLLTLLQRGASWEAISHVIENDPREAQQAAASGEYPLHQALRIRAAPDVILGLLRSFPQAATVANHMGNSALHLLVNNLSHFDRVRELFAAVLDVSEACVRLTNKSGELPLHIAARYAGLHSASQPQLAKEVIHALIGAYPKALRTADTVGDLPLHISLQRGVSPDVVSMLLESYPDGAHVIAHDGRYPMRIAFQNDCSLEVVRKILSFSGDNISVAEGSGSALHVAIKHKASEDILLDIIDRDPVSLTRLDSSGCSALHLALKCYASTPGVTVQVIRRLLDQSETCAAVKYLGVYPLQIALEKGLDVSLLEALAEAHPYNDEFKSRAEERVEKAARTEVGQDQFDGPASSESRLHPTPSRLLSQNSYAQGIAERALIAEQAAKERAERRAKAAQERAHRGEESAARRRKIAAEHAEQLQIARNERVEKTRSELLASTEAQQAALVDVEKTGPDKVAPLLQSGGTAGLISSDYSERRLARWKKVVTASAEQKQGDAGSPSAVSRSQETFPLAPPTSLQPALPPPLWNSAASVSAASTPSRNKYGNNLTSARSAGGRGNGGEKVEVSPYGSARAMTTLLFSSLDSSDEEGN